MTAPIYMLTLKQKSHGLHSYAKNYGQLMTPERVEICLSYFEVPNRNYLYTSNSRWTYEFAFIYLCIYVTIMTQKRGHGFEK